MIHTVKGFGIVNKAGIDVFLEFSCFFDDPADVDNLISGSSVFSKTSLNIWKFIVHILLKPGTKIRLIIFFAAKDGETIQSAKTRLGADCGSEHELLIAKFRLKLKKVEKTTRPFRYDLSNPL